jgi:hypothetical protein
MLALVSEPNRSGLAVTLQLLAALCRRRYRIFFCASRGRIRRSLPLYLVVSTSHFTITILLVIASIIFRFSNWIQTRPGILQVGCIIRIRLERHPITDAERLIVLFLILHLASSFEATKHGMCFAEHGLRADIRQFVYASNSDADMERLQAIPGPGFGAIVSCRLTMHPF